MSSKKRSIDKIISDEKISTEIINVTTLPDKRRKINKIPTPDKKKHIVFTPSPKPRPPVKKVTFNDDKDNTNKFGDDFPKTFTIIFPFPNGPIPTKNPEVKPPTIDMSCRNPICDHKSFEEDPNVIDIPNITEISNIDDLITLGKSYHCKKNTEFAGMNLRIMCNLIHPLSELKKMIGMENVKELIVNQILFFLQGNHTSTKCNKCIDCTFGLKCLNSQTEMLHTVISGPPGVGKTELGKILGKVYKEMGILSKDTFKLATRSDLIAGYLGQTAIKTQKVIDECKGGVLFIDEAYSLGNKELRDSFAKECIDTLNQNLSERRDFLCIIAGYEDELEKCFFSYNEGLRRRFTFRYKIEPYTSSQLLKIFEGKIENMDWKLCYELEKNDTPDMIILKNNMRESINKLFKKNIKKFPNYGGDMETLLLNCKIVHTRRCKFGQNEGRRIISFDDIDNGVKMFVKNRKYELNNVDSDDDLYKTNIYSF